MASSCFIVLFHGYFHLLWLLTTSWCSGRVLVEVICFVTSVSSRQKAHGAPGVTLCCYDMVNCDVGGCYGAFILLDSCSVVFGCIYEF